MYGLKFHFVGVTLLVLNSSVYGSNFKINKMTRCPGYQKNIAVLMDDFDIFNEKETIIIKGHFNLTDDIENSVEVNFA